MKHIYLTALLALLVGCSSAPQRVEHIDTKVESQHGSVQGAMIAIDKQGVAVVQKETHAEVELREQGWKNYDLERKLSLSHETLQGCLATLADPRLGGNGEVLEAPDLDVKLVTQKKELFGLTETGSLKIVEKEGYLDRLKAERQYQEVLEAAVKMVGKRQTKCAQSLRFARVKAGLSAEAPKPKGKCCSVAGTIVGFQAAPTLDQEFDGRQPAAETEKESE